MRYKAVVAYDGTDFEGWQSQVGGNTIQDILEKRLAFLLEAPTRIFGAGRTDAGVHANGQVFHFDGNWNAPPEQLVNAFRSNMPETIQVLAVEAAGDAFHAKSSATGKRYVYHLYEGYAPPTEVRFCWSLGRRRVDTERMREAVQVLIGEHDFTAFSGTRARNRDPNPVKDLRRLEVDRDGPRLRVTTEASGYMYKMVRSLVGGLVDVGTGKIGSDDVRRCLESKVRTALIPTAPARGLFLDRVFYGT